MSTRSRFSILALVVLVVLASACSDSSTIDETTRDASGRITAGGDLSVFKIQLGDCFNAADGDTLETVDAVPCAEPHQYEAYAKFDLTGDEFPDDEALRAQIEAGCLASFDTYVGAAWESSSLYFFPIRPSKETWEDRDDREVTCSLTTEDRSPR
jgi:hypothetical protein